MKKAKVVMSILIILSVFSTSFAYDGEFEESVDLVMVLNGMVDVRLRNDMPLFNTSSKYFQIACTEPDAKSMLAILLNAKNTGENVKIYYTNTTYGHKIIDGVKVSK